MKGFSSKRIALKIDVLQDRKICCFLRCVRASFRPELLQAVAMKGVKAQSTTKVIPGQKLNQSSR